MCGQGMQALDYLEASKVIYTNGCIDKLVNWIHSNLFLLGGVALGLAIPQVTYPVSLVGRIILQRLLCFGEGPWGSARVSGTAIAKEQRIGWC